MARTAIEKNIERKKMNNQREACRSVSGRNGDRRSGTKTGCAAWSVAFALAAALQIPAAAQPAHSKLQIIHSFRGQPNDGLKPSSLAMGEGGVLYGSTSSGGSANAGSVFAMTPPAAAGGAWTETTIYSFPVLPGGFASFPAVVAGKDGTLFGFTQTGGTFNCGTVFALIPPASEGDEWTLTVLYNFTGQEDGAYPSGLLVSSNALYGVTTSGGSGANGLVFSVTPPATPGGAWIETTLYSFTGGSDGGYPGTLIGGESGILYGATADGGNANNGVVFSLTPPQSAGGAWTETVLYAFNGGSDGENPVGLAVGSGGVLYGSTEYGGIEVAPECFSGCGTVYSLTPPASSGGGWSEEVLYRFNGASDGYAVYTGVAIGSGGVLYGTTAYEGGGSGGIPGGILFSLTPPASAGGAWSESVLHTFQIHGINGAAPDSLILNTTQGVLYGTTVDGGLMGGGTVFQMKL